MHNSTCKSNQSPFQAIVTRDTPPREFFNKLSKASPKAAGCALLVEQKPGELDRDIVKAALRCSDAIVFYKDWHTGFSPPFDAQNPQFQITLAMVAEKLDPDQFATAVLCAPETEYSWFASTACIGNGSELSLWSFEPAEIRLVLHWRDALTSKAPATWRSYYRQIDPIAYPRKSAA